MPFWSNYVNTNPEVDDDDLPLPQHRLIDDYGNQKACVTPEKSQLMASIKQSYFVRALSRRSREPKQQYQQHHSYQYRYHHHHQPIHSSKHYAKKSSPFSSKRRAEIVSVIKETLTSPFKYMVDHGRRSLSSISSMSLSPYTQTRSRSRSSSLTHHTKHTHNSRKTTRSANTKKRARSLVHHSNKTKSSRSRSPSSLSASAASSSSEELSTSPVSHVNLSPIPPHTQTLQHQPHQMTSSPQPKKPEQAVTPPASKRTRHSSNQAERLHSSNSGSGKKTSKQSHTSSTPCNEWSVSSLRQYAKQHSIPIKGLRNKTDIVNAITCATLHPENESLIDYITDLTNK